MANIKISELNEYTEVQDDDLFPIVDVANGETKKVKATNIGTGGKEIIMVGDESIVTKNTKLLIETDSLVSLGTEVVNSLSGNEVDKAPSVKAVNDVLTYSTEEQVVGAWMGKPLYRKVMTATLEASETAGTYVYTYIYPPSNTEEILVPYAKIKLTNGATTNIPYTFNADPSYQIKINEIKTNKITIATNYTMGGTVTLILEYTKTTD